MGISGGSWLLSIFITGCMKHVSDHESYRENETQQQLIESVKQQQSHHAGLDEEERKDMVSPDKSNKTSYIIPCRQRMIITVGPAS